MQNQDDHRMQVKLAEQVGYTDTISNCLYKPSHAHCTCVACQRAYGKGSDTAIRELIGKVRH